MIRNIIKSHHAIRGIAALFVFIFHLEEVLLLGNISLNSQVLSKSYLWVDCFFMLSGFILSYTYSEIFRINDLYSFYESAKKFFIARFFRIYPLHIFTIILLLLIRASSYLFFEQTSPFFRGNNNLYSLFTNIFFSTKLGNK